MAEAKADGNTNTSSGGVFLNQLKEFVNGASISSADGSDNIETRISNLYIEWMNNGGLSRTPEYNWEAIKRVLRSADEVERDKGEKKSATSDTINQLLASYAEQELLIRMRGLNIALQHWKQYEELAIGCIENFNSSEQVYWDYIFSKPDTGNSVRYTNPLAMLIYSSADCQPVEMKKILSALMKHVEPAFGTKYIFSILYALYYTYSDERNATSKKRKTGGETKRRTRTPLKSLKLRTKWLIFLNKIMPELVKLKVGSPDFGDRDNYALATVQTHEADDNDVFEIMNLNEMGQHVYKKYVQPWNKRDSDKTGWTVYGNGRKIWLKDDIVYWTDECWDTETKKQHAIDTAKAASAEAKAKNRQQAYDKAYAQCVRSHVANFVNSHDKQGVFVKGTLPANDKNDRLFLYLPTEEERERILGAPIYPNRRKYVKRLGKITLQYGEKKKYWKITNGISGGPSHSAKSGTRAHKESIYFEWYNEFMWVCKRWFKQTELKNLPRLVCA